jgi:hypothetical protein
MFLCTEIGNPIPHEQTLNRYNHVLTIWRYSLKKSLPTRFDVFVQNYGTIPIQNADVHAFCMQIDSTKKIVLLGVKSHTGPPFLEDFLGFEHHTVFRYDEGGLNEYQFIAADRL